MPIQNSSVEIFPDFPTYPKIKTLEFGFFGSSRTLIADFPDKPGHWHALSRGGQWELEITHPVQLSGNDDADCRLLQNLRKIAFMSERTPAGAEIYPSLLDEEYPSELVSVNASFISWALIAGNLLGRHIWLRNSFAIPVPAIRWPTKHCDWFKEIDFLACAEEWPSLQLDVDNVTHREIIGTILRKAGYAPYLP
jgi:hypothetical protein